MAKPTASDSGTNRARAEPLHEERGNEDGQDAEHGQQPRHRRLGVAAPHRQGHGVGAGHLRVDVLHLDGRLIDQDAHGQRQPAQRHQVDRLSRQGTGRRPSRPGPAEC